MNRLEVDRLEVAVGPVHEPLLAVTDVSFSVAAGGSLAIIGEVAVSTPIAKIAQIMLRLKPSEAAASSVGPSQPTITTSVAPIIVMARLVSTSGHASAAVARSSSCHSGFSIAITRAGLREGQEKRNRHLFS